MAKQTSVSWAVYIITFSHGHKRRGVYATRNEAIARMGDSFKMLGVPSFVTKRSYSNGGAKLIPGYQYKREVITDTCYAGHQAALMGYKPVTF